MESRSITYDISTTTPIFSYGANTNSPEVRSTSIRGMARQKRATTIRRASPEVRSTSIRGMVRWWFRALGKEKESNRIMGSAAGSKESDAKASRVIFRVEATGVNIGNYKILPHKKFPGKEAIKPASTFTLHVIERFKLEDGDWELLQRVIETWLMLGAIGGRSTRAGGSVYDRSLVFNSRREWLEKARYLLRGSKIEVYLSSSLKEFLSDLRSYCTDEKREYTRKVATEEFLSDLRSYCTDTVKNPCLGSANPRKESPLRFKIVRIGADYYIAFINDTREKNVIKQAISVLSGKPIGRILKSAYDG